MARSYGEYLRRVPSSEILDVYQSGTSDKIVVQKKNAKKIFYPVDTVFLYRNKHAETYRIYLGKVYA